MVFEVGFVHTPETEVVEHGIHLGRIRVVRCTDGIDVVTLHEEHVFQHRFSRYGTSIERMCIVTVHTLEEYALAVHIDDGILDFDVTETVLGRECHFILTAFTLDNAYSVEVRSFGCPSLEVLHVEAYIRLFNFLVSTEVDGYRLFSHKLTRWVCQLHNNILLTGQLVTVVEFESHVHLTFLVCLVSIELGSDVMVAYTYLRHVVDVHITEDTGHTEHILTFQIRAVAPTHYLYSQAVFTRTEVLGDIEFMVVVSTLGIAHIFAVQVNEGSTVDTTEVDEGTVLFPTFRQIEETYIRAYRVDTIVLATIVESLTGIDVWRNVGMRIFHITIDRTVVSVHFPVGWHRNGIPAAHVIVFLIEIQWTLRRFIHEMEEPVTVQRLHLTALGIYPRSIVEVLVAHHALFRAIRNVGSVTFFLVFGKHGFVFPIYLFTAGIGFGTRYTDTSRDDTEQRFQSLGFSRFLFYHHDVALIVHSSHPLRLVGRLKTDIVTSPKC